MDVKRDALRNYGSTKEYYFKSCPEGNERPFFEKKNYSYLARNGICNIILKSF